jgi:hypothetical protein
MWLGYLRLHRWPVSAGSWGGALTVFIFSGFRTAVYVILRTACRWALGAGEKITVFLPNNIRGTLQ